jgi:ligand-binding sensor domain-containing protein
MKSLILLFVLTCVISCNGQPNANPHRISTEKLPPKSGHTKLVRTLSKSEYEVVSCGLQDKKGNIWFGTTSEGVYKFDGKIFTQYTIQDGLVSNCIWSLLEDKSGDIWLGTSNGICLFKDNKISSIPINSFVRPHITDFSYYSDFSTINSVWSMLQDKSGKLWFGTGDGVYIYNGFNFTRFLANDNVINKAGLKLKLVSGMLEDKKGNMWFASGMPPGYEGLSRFDGKMIENFKPKNEGWYRTILERENGDILLATRHFGVWNYDGNSFNDFNHPKDLVKTSLNAILEDKSGNLWVASDYGKELGDTLGGLWYSTNPNDKSFTKISNKEVCFILEDKENNIWFGTRNMGLYRFDRKLVTKFSE